MAYIRGEEESRLGFFACGPGCQCEPCRWGLGSLAERYIPEEAEERAPRPALAGSRLGGLPPVPCYLPPQGGCVHGRWCGAPYCSGPGDPCDDVDACCKKHDDCYDQRGYWACSCDRELLRCLAPKINPKTRKGIAAGLMFGYFAKAPCNPWT